MVSTYWIIFNLHNFDFGMTKHNFTYCHTYINMREFWPIPRTFKIEIVVFIFMTRILFKFPDKCH